MVKSMALDTYYVAVILDGASNEFLLYAGLQDKADIECAVDCGPFSHGKPRGTYFSSMMKNPALESLGRYDHMFAVKQDLKLCLESGAWTLVQFLVVLFTLSKTLVKSVAC